MLSEGTKKLILCSNWYGLIISVLLPGKSHGWRNLVGCSPWGHKESDTTEWLPFPFPFHYFKGTEGLGKLYTHDVLKKKATIQEEVEELTDRELVSPSQLSPQLGVAPTALQNVIQRVLAESREKCATQRETEVYQKKSEWILGGYNNRYLPLETTVSLMKLRDTNNNFKKFRSWILFALQSSGSSPAAAKSLQSCPTLCDPIDGSPPGSPVPGILQARTLEWVAISFSNAWKWEVKVKSLSRVRLFETPWTAAHQAPPSMGFSRQEYWSGVPLIYKSPY